MVIDTSKKVKFVGGPLDGEDCYGPVRRIEFEVGGEVISYVLSVDKTQLNFSHDQELIRAMQDMTPGKWLDHACTIPNPSFKEVETPKQEPKPNPFFANDRGW